MSMDKNKDEISEWLYKFVCADYDQCAILSFKVIEFERLENVLDLHYEFYALETKKIGAHGLFKLGKFPGGNECFPYSVHYLRWKVKCIFDLYRLQSQLLVTVEMHQSSQTMGLSVTPWHRRKR